MTQRPAVRRPIGTGRDAVWPTVSEAEFERWIVRVAERNGWCGHHVRMSQAVVTGVHHGKPSKVHAAGRPECDLHDDAFGALDWQFWHPEKGRYIQRELKAEHGVVSRHQKRVLRDLQLCGVDAKVWRPSDEKEILATFSGAPPFKTGSIVGNASDEESA